SGTFQTVLGGFFCQSKFRPFSAETPSRWGPRNCPHSGSFCADTGAAKRTSVSSGTKYEDGRIQGERMIGLTAGGARGVEAGRHRKRRSRFGAMKKPPPVADRE